MLNHQFATGFPSNDLADAGVLIRQLDSLDDTDKPWLPCPLTGYNNWCAHFNDRWATSVINNDARVMYYDVLKDMARGGVGGLVLSPRVTIFCAYADDGNSMDNQKVCKPAHGDGHTCIPGCYRDGEQCADMNRDWLCSYPPSQLKNALQKHLDRGATKNNEIVVDTRSITSAPTEMIVAFFVVRGSTVAERNLVVNAHAAFLREYPWLPPERQPPILQLDLKYGGREPFSAFSL